MAFDDAKDFSRNVFGIVPVLLVPFLENGDRRAGDFYVELDVFGQAGNVKLDDPTKQTSRRLPCARV